MSGQFPEKTLTRYLAVPEWFVHSPLILFDLLFGILFSSTSFGLDSRLLTPVNLAIMTGRQNFAWYGFFRNTLGLH